jgi:ribose 5-phosphate isomerase B
MRVALCSDEAYPVHETVRSWLEQRGHIVVPFGSVATGSETPWALTAEHAAAAVAAGQCDQGILFCWTGTGASIAANKLAGIRAALCSDPGQVAAARIWNHANILCLSNRTLSSDMAKEMLVAWFDTEPGEQGNEGVELLTRVDARHRSR